MTVPANDRRKVYDGDGVTTVFNGPMAYSATHITAALVEIATGVVSSAGSFTVTQLGKSAGTRVTMAVAPPALYRLVLLRTLPYSQIVDITNQGAFNANVLEQGMDLLDMQIQQLADDNARTPRLGEADIDGSGKYDGNGNRLGNIADAVDGADVPNLAQVTGLIGPGSGPFLQEGVGAVIRTYQDRDRDVLHSTDFMSAAQISDVRGRTAAIDVTASVQAALNTGIRDIHFPAGIYRLSAKLNVVGSPIHITGDGPGVTELRWTAAAATEGLDVTLSAPAGLTGVAIVENLSLTTAKALAPGTALKITSPAGTAADRIMPRAIVRDVIAQGATSPLNDGWSYGIHLNNCSNSTIDTCYFIGKVNGSEPNYSSIAGFIYDNAVAASPHQSALTFVNVVAHYAQDMLRVSDFEGVLIDKIQFVGANNGVVVTGPLAFPHLSLTNSHINVSTTCVSIANVQEIYISDNLFFKQLGNFGGTGISLSGGAKKGRIIDNTFNNLNTDPAAVMNGIILDDSDDFYIEGNTFRKEPASPAGIGIWVSTSTSTDNYIGRNFYESGITPILDSGARTIRPNMGALVNRTAAQSFTAATPALITWQAAARETGEFWDVGQPTRLTCPVAGYYVVTASIQWDPAVTAGIRDAEVWKNGAPFLGSPYTRVVNFMQRHNLVTAPVLCAAGDYFTVSALSDTTQNMVNGNNTWFGIERVGDAA
jgi:hypothetical protein